MVACTLCKKYIHFDHCSDWVDAQVWCNICPRKHLSQLGLCQKCDENYFRKENAYLALDGKQVICKRCFEEQQKEQLHDMDGTADAEAIDDGVVDSEAVEQRSICKGSVVEDLEYQCCAKENCTNRDEPLLRTEHTRCHGCNGHCHIECFADGSDLCYVCAASSGENKQSNDDGSSDEEEGKKGDDNPGDDSDTSSEEDEEDDEARESGDDEEKIRQSAGSKRKKPSTAKDSNPKRRSTKK